MLKFLAVGFLGLMVGGLIAADSSTILPHLNWGASCLVHDFYQRFLRKDKSEKNYVLVGRLVTVALFFCAAGTVYLLDTAKEAFDIILEVGAGAGNKGEVYPVNGSKAAFVLAESSSMG